MKGNINHFFKLAQAIRLILILAMLSTSLVVLSQPTVTIGSPSVSITNTGPVTYTITYAGATTITLTDTDVNLITTGTATGSVAVSGSGTSTRTVTISAITGDGTLNISINAGTSDDGTDDDTGAGPATPFTVDNMTPDVPAAPNLKNSSDTGSSNSDNLTRDNTPTFDGSYAENDVTIKLYDGASQVGSNLVSGGNFSITSSTLSNGIHNDLKFAATDEAGNVSANSPSFTMNIDRNKPSVVLDDDHPDDIVRNADNVLITAVFTEANGLDGTPRISIGSDVSNVNMSISSALVWTYNWNVPSGNNGPAPVSISVDDDAGNANSAATSGTGPTTYTIDNNAPSFVSVDDTGDNTYRPGETITFDVDLGESGLTVTADLLVINSGFSSSQALNDDSDGTYSYTTGDVDTGGNMQEGASVAVTFTAIDVAGNSSTNNSLTLLLDKTSPSFVSGLISNSAKDEIVVTFNDAITITNENGFSVGGTSETISGVSGSGSNTLTFTLTGNVISSDVITLSYNSGSGNATDAVGNKLNSFTNSVITNNVKPAFFSALVADANPDKLVATFSEAITLSSIAGFSVSGTAGNISSVTGTGTSSLTFTLDQNVRSTDIILFSYSSGNAQGSTGVSLSIFSDEAVTNNVDPIPEPQDHVSSFTAVAASTSSIDISWTESGNPQLPENYLIVGRDALSGSFASVADGNPVANDSNWGNGNFAINVPVGTANLSITGLVSGRNYIFRVYPYTNVLGSIDFKTSATVPQDNATLNVGAETIITSGSGVATMSSVIDTKGEALAAAGNFTFTIDDDGASNSIDTAPTLIDGMVIRRDGANDETGDWTNAIAGVVLKDNGTGTLNSADNPGSFSITADAITITGIPNASNSDLGYVADDGTKDYSLVVWLRTDLVSTGLEIDNKKLAFTIADTDITVETVTEPLSSTLATSTVVSGNTKNIIEVTATELYWKSITSVSTTKTNFTVIVQATDANKNRDYNKTGVVDMDASTNPPMGKLESQGPDDTDEALVQGQFTRTDMQVNKVGSYKFRAVLSPLTQAISGTINFATGDAISDIVVSTFNPADNINYLLSQESPVNGDGINDLKVAEFVLRDGGAVNDNDGAETALTDITFDLSNFANIRQVAIHDGTSVVESKSAAASITFSDISSISADDDGTAVFSLYVSFKTNVTDNQNFQFAITSAAAAGSTFAAANAGGATSPLVGDDNRIEVTATQLDFHLTPLNSVQGINSAILPAQPQTFANDANGNLDVDFNATAVVSSSATTANIPVAFGNVSPGVLDFPSFQYTGTGNGTISVSAGGLNVTSNAIDVIHTSFANLDLGAANTNDNNGIEAQIDLLATAVDKAILGFSISAAQNTPNEPTLVDITVTFGNSISNSLTNLRLLSSTDAKYSAPETNVSNTTNVGADFVSFESINIPLNASNLYYFVVADIAATANFTSPAIFPKLEATGVNLTSGTLSANVVGRSYTFKDTSPPEIANLVPANGNNNFPQNGIISISFNEAVDAIDSIINVYSLATDTLVSTLKVESTSGDDKSFFFNPDLPFAGSPLDGDIDYYILIPIGDAINKGFKDKSGNAYGGITSSSEWVFKTSDNVAPFFTTDLPSPTLPAQAVNIIDKGFDLRIALDEPGKIFYIVVDQDVTTGTPTVDEIRNATFTGTINSGTADILRGLQYQYISIFDDTNFPTPSAGGANFRVWITAEDLANPSPNMMVDGDPSHPGSKSVDDVFTASPGSGLFIQNTPGNVPVDICLGEHQLIFEPVNIVEGSDNGFVTGTGQTINFILPPDFEYKTDNVNVIGQGGDISNVTFSFINNTILTITYDINGTNDRDKLVISGLEVKALGNIGTSGDIIRLGGSGALSIADGDPLISFNTTQITPVEFITVPNTFSIGDENVIIPLLTPSLNALDKGTRLFSGPGVFGDTLYIAAAGLGTHTITFNYTNEIGCTSEFSLDRNIFDSDNAIVGLSSTYCTNDDAVTILFNARQNFSLDSLLVRVSETQPAGIDTVDVFKVDSQGGVIISLDKVPASSNYEFVPSRFINVDNFDKFTNIVDVTNDGGLIGELTFTGIYQSDLNATLIDTLEKRVKIYYSPTSEIIIDGFNPIGDTLFDKGNTPPIITALVSLPGALEFCEDDGNIPLKGSTSSGFFSISMRVPNPADSSLAPLIVTDSIGFPGLVDNGDGSGFLQTQILVDSTIFSFGELEIKFTVISLEGGCNNSVAQTIRIHPKPIADFIVPPVICEDTPIAFADNTGYLAEDLDLIDDNPTVNNTVVPQTTRWIWDFNDLNSVFNPVTDTLSNTTHTYEDPGLYNVKLSSVSEFGCAADSTIQLIIGGLPTASFNMAGTSLNEEFKFSSTSDVLRSIGPFDHAIDSVAWDINGDGIFDIGSNDTNPLNNNTDTLNYNYADSLSFGTYNVNFMAISTTGCTTTISPTLIVLKNIQADSTSAGSYKETFTLDDGNWLAVPEFGMNGDTILSTSTWAWGAPTKSTIVPGFAQASNVWITGLTDFYDSAERSYVYSPAFDLRNLARPMIQLDIFKDFEALDGVIFEYSTDSFNIMDSRKVWKALRANDGNDGTNEGIEWFNAKGLAASPGNDATGLGWTGSDTSWVTAKHSLGDVYSGGFTPEKIDSIKSRVLFRIGIGALAAPKFKDGFAFDNVFIGNRTRTVLLENFTSMAQGANTKFENEAINTLATGTDGTELIVLTYHTSFAGDDLLNLDNPSEPGARALYYGVSTSPRVAIDGSTGPDGSTSNSNLLFTDWGETFYSKRTLQLAPFEIILELDRDNINDGKVRIFADITAKEDIDTSFVVHVAVVEKEILPGQIGISGVPVSGEDIFYNTLRKLLPSPAGTRFIGSKVQGSQISVNETWDPTNVVDPDGAANLQVIVFIQDELSQEILQAASINFSEDIVLAVEQELSDNGVALYPNPADRQLTIMLGEKLFKDERAIIFDNTGRRIEEIGLQTGQDLIELNTIDYRPGIYLFTLPTETGAITKRFVIRRR